MDILQDIKYVIFYPSFFDMIIFPGLIAGGLFILFAIWFERKIAARVQMRVGPYYVSRFGGIAQLLADAIRVALQEIIIPAEVNPTLYVIAPIFPLLFAFLPLAFLPIGVIPEQGSVFSAYYHSFFDPSVGMGVIAALPTEYSLIAVLAVEAAYPIFVILQAWATNNRFALVGAVREAYLSVAYDVLILMSVIAIAVEYHTLDVAKVVQSGIPGIVANPLAAFVFFVGLIMATSRFPFEIVEAESELVTGPATEYSGLLFLLSMGGSYFGTYVYALYFAAVFLGGWYPLLGFPGAVILFLKAVIIVLFSVFLRSVYGRYRIDQALRNSWRLLLPVALASIVLGIVGGWLWIR
ncbi:MAG: NADH-quinone oxidoreductase subunit NuoH [Sulfolobaceae archaeon]|nr:NADH-quinone oxidoreductase subunit NuoH [Sulfolobales archaeon]